VDARDHNAPSAVRDAALSRVFAYRERGQARPMPVRAALAVFGGVLLVASIRMIVLLPEVGIPALLIALRLLAVEADWAARAYAWTDWRFAQIRDWFHRQSRLVRWAIVVGLFLVAAAIVWLLI
jgi:hypothetical protein